MRIRPRWWIGVVAVVAYAAWVTGVWLWRDIDYRAIADAPHLVPGVIQPLGVAAVALALFVTWAGWWRATLVETPRLHRPWLLAALLLAMLGFIATMLATTDFGGIAPRHLALLATATLLVGFCEEMLTRGVALVALRGSLRSEVAAWFASTALFGLLHASNALFGVGALALLQVLLAFCVGTGLYLLRRLGGTLLLPMLVHAAWDFATLTGDLDTRPMAMGAVALIMATYALSLGLAWVVLRGDHGPPAARNPA